MALRDPALKAAKPKDKPYRVSDGQGLALLVRPSGSKMWQLRFVLHGKEQIASLGTYPAVGLADARKLAEAARALIAAGKHPTEAKREAAAKAQAERENTFAVIAAEWMGLRADAAPATRKKLEWIIGILTAATGDRPITGLSIADMHAVVRPLVAAGKRETARRVLGTASRVFAYAASTGRCEHDPAAILLKGEAIPTPVVTNRAAITDPALLGHFLRAVDHYPGSPVVRMALRILPHVMLRPGELRQSEWSWIDTDAQLWSIPTEIMKMRRPHVVPISGPVAALLDELRPLTANTRYLFPNLRSAQRPMSDMAMNAAMRSMGFGSDDVSAHGFRSTASTLLNESDLWSADAIERQLAHVDKNAVRGDYDRGERLDERRKMLSWWSEHLDGLKARSA